MKSILLAVLVLVTAACPAMADPWTPNADVISKLEASVQLPDWGRSTMYPKGHVPAVSEFIRYYVGIITDGHRTIQAEFLDPEGERMSAGIHVVDSPRAFPTVMDGGCHIVNLIFDVEASRIVSLTCNGYA